MSTTKSTKTAPQAQTAEQSIGEAVIARITSPDATEFSAARLLDEQSSELRTLGTVYLNRFVMNPRVEVEIARAPGDARASVVINLGNDEMHTARDATIHVNFEGTAREIEAIARALLGTVEKAKRDGTLSAETPAALPVPKAPKAPVA